MRIDAQRALWENYVDMIGWVGFGWVLLSLFFCCTLISYESFHKNHMILRVSVPAFSSISCPSVCSRGQLLLKMGYWDFFGIVRILFFIFFYFFYFLRFFWILAFLGFVFGLYALYAFFGWRTASLMGRRWIRWETKKHPTTKSCTKSLGRELLFLWSILLPQCEGTTFTYLKIMSLSTTVTRGYLARWYQHHRNTFMLWGPGIMNITS